MNFFGLGVGELLLIAVLTLVVVGPERLPVLARKTGQMLVAARNWIQRSPDAQMVLRMRQELEAEIETLRSSLAEVQHARDEVIHAARQIGKTVEDDLVAPVQQAVAQVQQAGDEAINAARQIGIPPDERLAVSVQPVLTEERTVPRGSSRAAIVNGQCDDLPLGDLELDEQRTIAPPNLLETAPPEIGVPAPTIELEASPIDAAPAVPPPVPNLEQINARLEMLLDEMHTLQAALKRRGLLDEDWRATNAESSFDSKGEGVKG